MESQLFPALFVLTPLGLGIGVGTDEIHAFNASADHVLDGVAPTPTDPDDLDHRIFRLGIHQFEHNGTLLTHRFTDLTIIDPSFADHAKNYPGTNFSYAPIILCGRPAISGLT